MNKHKASVLTISFLVLVCVSTGLAQGDGSTAQVPVATQWVIGGARNPAQKGAIKSVILIICPKDGKKGTGFLLAGRGVVVTNSHVVGSCTAQELKATSSLGKEVAFSKLEQDKNRDLALLCPSNALADGLQLGADENPEIETEVETWGYPLGYQSPAPILSRGYVAGYLERRYQPEPGQIGNPVKHLIINGAFNPGNSGGPLIDRTTGRVIGVVVEKWGLFSPLAETVIRGLNNSSVNSGGGFQRTDEHGNVVGVSNEQATAAVLKEFYDASQVMIGEAISVSELNGFLKAKQHEVGCAR